MSEPEQWYWDLNKKRAVRAADRGLGADTLGPYGSKAEAENWQSLVEERNESWDDADEEWTEHNDDEE